MNFDIQELEKHIPHYLVAKDQKVLVRELRAISEGGSAGYILSKFHDKFKTEMLQGDGWKHFKYYRFDKNELQSVFGIVLSNTCDVDKNNLRDSPINITFAPLVKLKNFEIMLSRSGIDAEKIQGKIAAIRSQKVTSIFFIPAGGSLEEDYIVKLDDIHSIPLKSFEDNDELEKIFTLSNTGFYMLLLKLSIHFCRFQEEINRNEECSSVLH